MKNKVPTVLGFSIVTILSLTIAILVWKYSKLDLPVAQITYPINEKNQKKDTFIKNTIIPNSDTKEFKNTRYNFKIKYPSNYLYDENIVGDALYSVHFGPSYEEVYEKKHPYIKAPVEFQIVVNSGNSLDTFIQEDIKKRGALEKSSEFQDSEIISGIKATVIKSCDIGRNCSKILFFSQKGLIYYIHINQYYTLDNFEIQNAESEMLNSFSFYDPNGWDIYEFSANGKLYKTNDWNSFSTEEDKDSHTTYSFKFPNTWTLNGTVFHDNSNRKVAEILSNYVQLETNQTCFDNSSSTSDKNHLELISQKEFKIGQNIGVTRIFLTHPEGDAETGHIDSWYPNTYCIQEGGKAFVITFYSLKNPSSDINLYKEIISSFKFTK